MLGALKRLTTRHRRAVASSRDPAGSAATSSPVWVAVSASSATDGGLALTAAIMPTGKDRGRTEAYAGLIARTVPAGPPPAAGPRPRTRITRALRLTPARIRRGRPASLALRLLAGFLLAEITGHAGAGPAPTAGVLTGLHLAGDHRPGRLRPATRPLPPAAGKPPLGSDGNSPAASACSR